MKGILFPYELIEKNSKVIIYGYNQIALSFYEQVMAKKYCDIICWIIEKQENSVMNMSHPFIYIDELGTYDYDYIVLTDVDKSNATRKMSELVNIGINREKIIWSDTNMINYVGFPVGFYKQKSNKSEYLKMIVEYTQGAKLVDGYFYQSCPDLGIQGIRNTLERIRMYKLDSLVKNDMDVLDIGCNVGFLDLEIAKYANSVTGIEVDKHFVNVANCAKLLLEITNCEFVCEDIRYWKDERRFNVVIACAVHNWIGINKKAFVEMIDHKLHKDGIFVFESNSLEKIDFEFEDYINCFISLSYEIVGESFSESKIGRRKCVLLRKCNGSKNDEL